MSTDYDFLNSLDVYQLQSLLQSHPKTASVATEFRTEADKDIARKRVKRAAQRDILIPPPADLSRRNAALESCPVFLTTYFPDVFYEAFTQDRLDMIETIINAAMYGGDQAIAGPRGEGKTRLALYTALYLMIRRLSPFPIVVGKSQGKSQNELRSIREKLQQAELFIADFPEVGVPFKQVGGWSSRARMQTVGGVNTNIEIAADHLIFPTVGIEQLTDWPEGCEPVSCGQIIASVGVDGPIRGTTYRDRRPTIAIIDDIEDREAAASEVLIAKNEEIIEQDIAGLGPSSQRVSRVMLCTIQNRKCIAYKYTDPKQKPSWKGRRYRKMITKPDRMDLVDEYIQLRRSKSADDPDARIAFNFWKENQTTLESGCEISNRNSFDKRLHADGEPLELSAIQAYFNRVADVGEKAVATEIDNDPPADAGPTGSGLTADLVASRISGLVRTQCPADTIAVTAAIDIGKYKCHWVIIAWRHGAGGCVIDYGVAEVIGNDKINTGDRAADMFASEPAIYRALLNWRDEIQQKELVDTTGTARKVDFCLVDSGTYTQAVYEFCRQVCGIFHPSKGIPNYRPRKEKTDDVIPSSNLHAQRLPAQGLWLYELDTDYWKQWVHERFLTPTFDEDNLLRRGSLSLFQEMGRRSHQSYSQHIVAEELVSEFKEGKGVKTFWDKRNENNHWLDATYMACAASEVVGVKLFAPSESEVTARNVKADEAKEQRKRPKPKQHGRFIQRPGGWVPRRRS